MKKRILNKIRVPSAKPEDQPASRKMLKLVRDELKSDMRSIDLKIDSFKAEVKSEINRIDGRLSKVDADLTEVKSSVHRMEFLLEEQNSNNRIVLEGLQALRQRQDRIENLIAK